MTAPDRCAAFFAALLAAALTAGAAAASEPAALPAKAIRIADATAAADSGAGVTPDSRLLRMLSERAAPLASEPPREARVAELGPVSAGMPENGGAALAAVLQGCPRALLAALLAGATETADTVSALAIERETLTLCRERQEIVNGIVALEDELQALLAEAQGETGTPGTGGGAMGSADAPIVKVSAPVRVIEVPTPMPLSAETAEAATTAPAPAPKLPSYSWFSIVGTAGDLRAGIADGTGNGGTRGGMSVWFVREGDSLPGGVTVTRIAVRPPGVHVEGAVQGALPYGPRPSAVAGPRRDAKGDGS